MGSPGTAQLKERRKEKNMKKTKKITIMYNVLGTSGLSFHSDLIGYSHAHPEISYATPLSVLNGDMQGEVLAGERRVKVLRRYLHTRRSGLDTADIT